MLKRICVCSFFCLMALRLPAQLMDSLPGIFRKPSTIDARLESRISFIGNQLVNVSGFRGGLIYNRLLRVGGGLSWLNSTVTVPKPGYLDHLPVHQRVRHLKFAYLCVYADFVFHKTKRWQLSVPLQLGTGMSWFQDRRDYHTGNRDTKYFLLLYEPGITVQYKVTKWAGLGTDVAYRFTLRNHDRVGEKLSSPTYSFKLLLWFDYLFFDLFPNHELSKRFGPAVW